MSTNHWNCCSTNVMMMTMMVVMIIIVIIIIVINDGDDDVVYRHVELSLLLSFLAFLSVAVALPCLFLPLSVDVVTRQSEGRGICFTVCFFFVFVCSVNDFSTTCGPIQAKFCMLAYSGSGCVFSPFGGWRPPAGGKRGK